MVQFSPDNDQNSVPFFFDSTLKKITPGSISERCIDTTIEYCNVQANTRGSLSVFPRGPLFEIESDAPIAALICTSADINHCACTYTGMSACATGQVPTLMQTGITAHLRQQPNLTQARSVAHLH